MIVGGLEDGEREFMARGTVRRKLFGQQEWKIDGSGYVPNTKIVFRIFGPALITSSLTDETLKMSCWDAWVNGLEDLMFEFLGCGKLKSESDHQFMVYGKGFVPTKRMEFIFKGQVKQTDNLESSQRALLGHGSPALRIHEGQTAPNLPSRRNSEQKRIQTPLSRSIFYLHREPVPYHPPYAGNAATTDGWKSATISDNRIPTNASISTPTPASETIEKEYGHDENTPFIGSYSPSQNINSQNKAHNDCEPEPTIAISPTQTYRNKKPSAHHQRGKDFGRFHEIDPNVAPDRMNSTTNPIDNSSAETRIPNFETFRRHNLGKTSHILIKNASTGGGGSAKTSEFCSTAQKTTPNDDRTLNDKKLATVGSLITSQCCLTPQTNLSVGFWSHRTAQNEKEGYIQPPFLPRRYVPSSYELDRLRRDTSCTETAADDESGEEREPEILSSSNWTGNRLSSADFAGESFSANESSFSASADESFSSNSEFDAGLVFPVTRVRNEFRYVFSHKIHAGLEIGFRVTALVEFLVASVLCDAGKEAKRRGSERIKLEHVRHAILRDAELFLLSGEFINQETQATKFAVLAPSSFSHEFLSPL